MRARSNVAEPMAVEVRHDSPGALALRQRELSVLAAANSAGPDAMAAEVPGRVNRDLRGKTPRLTTRTCPRLAPEKG